MYLCSRVFAMPVFASVLSLSRRVLRFKMSCRSMAIDLKKRIKECTGTKCGDQAIVMQHDARHLNNEELLVNFVEWLVIRDVMDWPTLKAMTFELTVYLVVRSKHCANCGEPAAQKCSRCMNTRYCSQLCQQQHWPIHKLNGCFLDIR